MEGGARSAIFLGFRKLSEITERGHCPPCLLSLYCIQAHWTAC